MKKKILKISKNSSIFCTKLFILWNLKISAILKQYNLCWSWLGIILETHTSMVMSWKTQYNYSQSNLRFGHLFWPSTLVSFSKVLYSQSQQIWLKHGFISNWKLIFMAQELKDFINKFLIGMKSQQWNLKCGPKFWANGF